MIKYSLVCHKDHEFEAWFRNSSAFETQIADNDILCPVCESRKVRKALMAPNLGAASVGKSKKNRKSESMPPETHTAGVPERNVPTQDSKTMLQPPSDADAEAAKSFFRELRSFVKKNADYVGDKFAEEARRIHFNEVKPRGIYGESTPDEIHALQEDGINVFPLPTLPEDQN